MARLLILVTFVLTACGTAPLTQVILVRHAEKADASRDTDLSEAGQQRAARLAQVVSEVPLRAVYATQFRRTQATVTPAAAAQHQAIEVMDAGDIAGLVRSIQDHHQGETVLVAAHSNTIPKIVAALGGPAIADLAEDAFDDLFILSWVGSGKARLLRLHLDRP